MTLGDFPDNKESFNMIVKLIASSEDLEKTFRTILYREKYNLHPTSLVNYHFSSLLSFHICKIIKLLKTMSFFKRIYKVFSNNNGQNDKNNTL